VERSFDQRLCVPLVPLQHRQISGPERAHVLLRPFVSSGSAAVCEANRVGARGRAREGWADRERVRAAFAGHQFDLLVLPVPHLVVEPAKDRAVWPNRLHEDVDTALRH